MAGAITQKRCLLALGVGAACLLGSDAWAKPILPGAPGTVVGEKGVGPVDPKEVAAAEMQRAKDLAAVAAWNSSKEARASKLAAGRKALEKDPAASLKIAEELLAAFSKDEAALDLKKNAEEAIRRKADREKKAADEAARKQAEADRKAREAADEAVRKRAEEDKKALQGKLRDLVSAGDAALKAGKLEDAAAQFNAAASLAPEDKAVKRGLERVAEARAKQSAAAQKAKEEAARAAAERSRLAGFQQSLTAVRSLLSAGKFQEAKDQLEGLLQSPLSADQKKWAKEMLREAEKALKETAKKEEKEKERAKEKK